VCITQFKVQSCDWFWGVWFVEGHVSNTKSPVSWVIGMGVSSLMLFCFIKHFPIVSMLIFITVFFRMLASQNTTSMWVLSSCIRNQSWIQERKDQKEEERKAREVVRAKLEQDQLERQARQRASESAGEDGLVWFS